jgi:murein L,D-transpeptidase YcbB/YkuD
MVNIPDFTLKVVHDHKTLFHTRIVVGKPGTPSPSFSAAIDNILVNPSWHVPQSIIYKEYLPALQQDPSVLERMGLTLKHERDGSISITQPPSERNALGRIKFNFPNKFQVYLHDTPDKRLFSQERRAYSHGCMRVQNPTRFGEVLLSLSEPPELRYSAQRLQQMFGSEEHWLNLKKKIPVYLVYMNAYVDDAGKLVVRNDLYKWDERVRSALNGRYMVVNERSQKGSSAGEPGPQLRRSPVRQAVREPARDSYWPQQRRSFFPFPWFQ